MMDEFIDLSSFYLGFIIHSSIVHFIINFINDFIIDLSWIYHWFIVDLSLIHPSFIYHSSIHRSIYHQFYHSYSYIYIHMSLTHYAYIYIYVYICTYMYIICTQTPRFMSGGNHTCDYPLTQNRVLVCRLCIFIYIYICVEWYVDMCRVICIYVICGYICMFV